MRSSGAHQSPRARAFRLGRQSFRFDSKLAMRDMPAGYQTSLDPATVAAYSPWSAYRWGMAGLRRPPPSAEPSGRVRRTLREPFSEGTCGGQDPLRSRWHDRARTLHRRLDRLLAAPPGAVAEPLAGLLQGLRGRRHLGRGPGGHGRARRAVGPRALRLVGARSRPPDPGRVAELPTGHRHRLPGVVPSRRLPCRASTSSGSPRASTAVLSVRSSRSLADAGSAPICARP